MKSFLCKGKKPIIKWGSLPDENYFEFNGKVPRSYFLAINPSKGYIVLDVDVDEKNNVNGFLNIPKYIREELEKTLNYETKHKGRHYWLKYTGSKTLPNSTSGKNIDLRTHKGYVIWYPEGDIRSRINEVKETTKKLNNWIEKLFYCKTKIK